MKILILCKKVPFPPTDGESIVIMNDIRVLKELGHEVFLFCLNTKKHRVDTLNYENEKNWDGFQSDEINTNSLSSLISAFFSSYPLQIARFYSKEIDHSINELVDSHKLDCVIYQGLATTQYLRNNEIRKIYRVHNLEYRIWENLQSSANVLKKLFYTSISASLFKYEGESLSFLSAIVTLSAEECAAYKKRYSAQTIASIPISIDGLIRQTYSSNKKGLLFIGSLDWQPNREGLDWFLKEVYPSISHIPLTIAGKGNYKCDLTNVNNISNYESTDELLASHRLMIVPLLSGAGIRIKIVEGMKFGMPMISTSIGAEGIECMKESLLIENSAQNWVIQIQEIYNHSNRLEELSERLKSSYEIYYSDAVICSKWKTFFANLLA